LLSNNTTEKDERINCLGAPNVHLGRIENSRCSSRNRLSASVYGSSGASVSPELPYTGAYFPSKSCFCWNFCYLKS